MVALALPSHAAAGPVAFSSPTNFVAGDRPFAVAAGDFDRDGNPDLAVANFGSSNVSILLGDGRGSFSAPANLFVEPEPNDIATGDFNGDGDLDLAVVNGRYSDVTILLGAAGGTFSPPTTYQAGIGSASVAIGEFNGDGDPDLAVANRGSNDVSILLGADGGRFVGPMNFAAGEAATSVAVGDFDRDGAQDLAVANYIGLGGAVSILVGDGGGTFKLSSSTALPAQPASVAIGDFNGDGDPDLAVASDGSDVVSVLLGSIGATFGSPTAHRTGGLPNSVAVADLNGDLDPELVTANGRSNDVSVLTGGVAGGFSAPVGFAAGLFPTDVAAADFNRDGALDLAVTNQDSDNVSILFNITDNLPPNTTITSGPSGLTNDSTPTFAFSSSEPTGATFECRFYQGAPSGAYSACNSPHTRATPLADGAWTFEVRARDAAGNIDGSPAQRTFTVDTVAPSTTITSGPTGPTNDSTPTFGFSSEAGATFECRFYQGAASGTFTACSSPHTPATALAQGAWTFEVRARDAAGNVGAPAQRSFTVDTVAPSATITAGPTGTTTDNTPQFSFSSSEPTGGTLECRVYQGAPSGAFSTCTSPHTTAPLPDGASTFEVRARDAAGNVGAPAQRTFTVDATPPDTAIDSGPSGTTTDTTPTFDFSSEPGATFACRVYQGEPSGAFGACTSPYTPASPLAEGAWTFEVRASDADGNADPTPATRTFTVLPPDAPPPDAPPPDATPADATPPDTKIESGPTGVTRDRTPSFSFSSAEPGATFECSLDGGAFAPCSSPFALDRSLPAGTHVFRARARDGAGNVDPTPATFVFVIPAALADLPPPQIGRTFNVEPVGDGEVFVSESAGAATARASQNVPGIKGRRFVPLREARQVAMGSILDTRRGRVRLQSARDARGTTQAGEFFSGVFQVLQSRSRSARGLTELGLKGSSFGACRRAGHGKKAGAARHSRRIVRRLRGNARGRFSTRGRHSAATVRGTVWDVRDRCDGTLTKVTRGKVAVRDFRLRKTVLLRAGKSYLARARR